MAGDVDGREYSRAVQRLHQHFTGLETGLRFIKPDAKELAGLDKLAADAVKRMVNEGILKRSEVDSVFKMLKTVRNI